MLLIDINKSLTLKIKNLKKNKDCRWSGIMLMQNETKKI